MLGQMAGDTKSSLFSGSDLSKSCGTEQGQVLGFASELELSMT